MSTSDKITKLKEAAAAKPHGDRNRYCAGCRCFKCRLANSRYEARRKAERLKGNDNPQIDAAPVRAHLAYLSSKGIGYKTVAAYSGVGKTTVLLIATGKRTKILKQNARAILDVDESCVTDATVIDAKETWKRINWLLREGFGKGQIARRIGCATGNLQIKKDRVTARTANRIEKFYNTIRAGE